MNTRQLGKFDATKEIVMYTKVYPDFKDLDDIMFLRKYKNKIIKLSKKDEEKEERANLFIETKNYESKDAIQADINKWLDAINEKNAVYRKKVKAVRDELNKGAIDASSENAVKQAKKVAQDSLNDIDSKYYTEIKTPLSMENITNEIENRDSLPPINVENILNDHDFITNQAKGSGSTFLLLGASKSGKTFLMCKMAMMWKQLFPKTIIILISDTQKADGGPYKALKDMAGEDLIYGNAGDTLKMARTLQKENDGAKPILVLLDDHATDKHNKNIIKLFIEDRNLNISTMMSSQECKLFNKTNRSNVNYIMFGKMNTPESIKDCYDVFLKGYYSGTKKTDYINQQGKKVETYQYVVDFINDTKNYNKLFLNNLTGFLYQLK